MRFLLMAAALVASASLSQPAAVDVATLGPKVGERVPSFSLPDQRGATRDMKSIAGPKGTVLVFFRSADW